MKRKLEYDKYCGLREYYHRRVSLIANLRMILFIVMIVSFILKYYYYPSLFQALFILSLCLFVVMVLIHDKYFKIYDYYVKYVDILDLYLDRESGKWKNFWDKGEDFFDEKHAFLQDLDILGESSLFQYLSVCKTLGGREVFVRKLSNFKIEQKTLEDNQEAIGELAKKIHFVIHFQVMLSSYDKKQVHLERDFACLEHPGHRRNDFIVGIILSILCISLLIGGIWGVVSFSWFYIIFLFNVMISYLYGNVFQDEFSKMEKIVFSYGKLDGLFKAISDEQFISKLLMDKQMKVRRGREDVKKIHWLEMLTSLRNNFLSNFILNGFGCLSVFSLYSFSRICSSMKNFREAILEVEELEAMISLAGIGILKENCCMPTFEDEVALSFSDIRHPLLEESVCVGNDYQGKAGVNIITGSNMGGKTTFLRTIGINLILMNAGGFVCASSFHSSYFKLFTSMRIVDNVDRGVSTFYGELLRIQEMIEYVDQGNMLVLIDEIFKGTNYQDRIYGAREVIRRLNTKRTISFVTTHDFELCDNKRVRNFHVKEDYDGDKIIFDYKIYKGMCTSTNAKYLMKKLGIIE